MGKLDPQLEEYFSEGITNFLLEIFNKIEKRKKSEESVDSIIDKNIDEIFEDFAQREQGKIHHNLSKELINNIKENMVKRILKNMYEGVKLSTNSENKILEYALKLFIKKCSFFEVVELEE